MKNILYIAVVFLTIGIIGCDSTTRIEELNELGDPGAIPALIGSLDTLYKLSDVANSGATFDVEFIDGDNGNSVASYNWFVSYKESPVVSVASFTSFTANENGNQSINGTLAFQDALDALNLTAGDMAEGDTLFYTATVVLNDGTVFTDANGGVTYNELFDFSAIIDTETVVLTDATVSGAFLRNGQSGTISLVFDEDIVTVPTITRISAGGNTDDVVGTPVITDDADSVVFSYTAGASASDVATFVVSGAEAVAGFPSVSDTLEIKITTDNVTPTALLSSIEADVDNATDSIESVTVAFNFAEVVTEEFTFDVTSASFDSQSITVDPDEDSETVSFTFTPMIGTSKILRQQLTFDVAISGGTDLAGNAINTTITGVILND
ncbi:MAG: hypothetical protein WBA74_00180 [Cyclobacteriaceae bacterium]